MGRRVAYLVILAGVALLVVGLVVAFSAIIPEASHSLGSPEQEIYQVTGGLGPIPVSVTWQTLSGAPYVVVQYCPPGTSPPGGSCSQPESLNGMYSENSPSGGNAYGSVPAGSLLVMTTVGPAGSSARVTIDIGSPTLGIATVGFGACAIAGGVWMRSRAIKIEDATPSSPPPDWLSG
jgi:hypothetical protein